MTDPAFVEPVGEAEFLPSINDAHLVEELKRLEDYRRAAEVALEAQFSLPDAPEAITAPVKQEVALTEVTTSSPRERNVSLVRSPRQGDLIGHYFNDIKKYPPLLKKEDQINLAQTIERGKEAKAELVVGGIMRMAGFSYEDSRDHSELMVAVNAGKEAFWNLYRGNLRLVVSVAQRYNTGRIPLLDLIQEGNIGLIQAVEKFDWRRGNKFSSYAQWPISQAIRRYIHEKTGTIRLPDDIGIEVARMRRVRIELEERLNREPEPQEIAEKMGITVEKVLRLSVVGPNDINSLDLPLKNSLTDTGNGSNLYDLIADPAAAKAFEDFIDAEVDREKISSLLDLLEEEDERTILALRFGLDGEKPHTLTVIGERLNIHSDQIRNIQNRALVILRRAVNVEILAERCQMGEEETGFFKAYLLHRVKRGVSGTVYFEQIDTVMEILKLTLGADRILTLIEEVTEGDDLTKEGLLNRFRFEKQSTSYTTLRKKKGISIRKLQDAETELIKRLTKLPTR